MALATCLIPDYLIFCTNISWVVEIFFIIWLNVDMYPDLLSMVICNRRESISDMLSMVDSSPSWPPKTFFISA